MTFVDGRTVNPPRPREFAACGLPIRWDVCSEDEYVPPGAFRPAPRCALSRRDLEQRGNTVANILMLKP
eukprot:4452413-Lingulodinium_polyedra.AAC.1